MIVAETHWNRAPIAIHGTTRMLPKLMPATRANRNLASGTQCSVKKASAPTLRRARSSSGNEYLHSNQTVYICCFYTAELQPTGRYVAHGLARIHAKVCSAAPWMTRVPSSVSLDQHACNDAATNRSCSCSAKSQDACFPCHKMLSWICTEFPHSAMTLPLTAHPALRMDTLHK